MIYYMADYKTDTSPSQSEEKHLVLIIINCERAQESQGRPELLGKIPSWEFLGAPSTP
jgi:hypothetical protein